MSRKRKSKKSKKRPPRANNNKTPETKPAAEAPKGGNGPQISLDFLKVLSNRTLINWAFLIILVFGFGYSTYYLFQTANLWRAGLQTASTRFSEAQILAISTSTVNNMFNLLTLCMGGISLFHLWFRHVNKGQELPRWSKLAGWPVAEGYVWIIFWVVRMFVNINFTNRLAPTLFGFGIVTLHALEAALSFMPSIKFGGGGNGKSINIQELPDRAKEWAEEDVLDDEEEGEISDDEQEIIDAVEGLKDTLKDLPGHEDDTITPEELLKFLLKKECSKHAARAFTNWL